MDFAALQATHEVLELSPGARPNGPGLQGRVHVQL